MLDNSQCTVQEARVRAHLMLILTSKGTAFEARPVSGSLRLRGLPLLTITQCHEIESGSHTVAGSQQTEQALVVVHKHQLLAAVTV